MFTGIVEEVGRVKALRRSVRSCVLSIDADTVVEGTAVGDSIAVNGVCLTVTELGAAGFSADVMNETLARSSLGALRAGHPVNLERAMVLDGRFGGHIVSGHIDGCGTITSIEEDGNAVWYTIAADADILGHIVEKGSIAIDGISLTVAGLTDSDFSVSLIPHTRAQTNLASKGAGDVVNLECDVIGKYVERFMQLGTAGATGMDTAGASGGITEEFLLENGF